MNSKNLKKIKNGANNYDNKQINEFTDSIEDTTKNQPDGFDVNMIDNLVTNKTNNNPYINPDEVTSEESILYKKEDKSNKNSIDRIRINNQIRTRQELEKISIKKTQVKICLYTI